MPGEPIHQHNATAVSINGTRAVGFAGCNYLGLAHDPRVLDAARSALGCSGLSTSASRETSGNSPDHAALEQDIAAFISHRQRPGLLLPDGYTANLAAAQAIAQSRMYAVIDEHAHKSLFDAARVADLRIVTYGHLRGDKVEGLLGGLDGPAVVMTDGVFTAHGHVAPVADLVDALRAHDTLLFDDCHGFCVLGEGGRGTCDEFGVTDPRVVITTTLAKGLGCGGGIVVGPAELINRMQTVSTAYICTTPVSPVVAAAAREALRVVVDEPERVDCLRRNASLLGEACGTIPDGSGDPPTPIAAFPAPAAMPGERFARSLLAQGLYVPLMSYPGGPCAEYFRASVTSQHSEDQIRRLALALTPALSKGPATCLR